MFTRINRADRLDDEADIMARSHSAINNWWTLTPQQKNTLAQYLFIM
jgi:hypothetical protein